MGRLIDDAQRRRSGALASAEETLPFCFAIFMSRRAAPTPLLLFVERAMRCSTKNNTDRFRAPP